jgi:hypothetical protein
MNIPYKLTLNEYQEAAMFHYKTGKRPLLVAVFLGMATFMMLIGTDFSNTREVIYNMFMTFFALSFYILFTRMITAYQAKRIYTKSPILSHDVTLHISGKGINLNKSVNTTILPWDTFRKWKKNEKYYLIYTNIHQFNVIPKRVINEKQEEELNLYLEKYL